MMRDMEIKKAAFIGLGNMGLPMAINLAKADFDLAVFDINPAAMNRAKESGLSAASSAKEAAAGREFVFSMLPAGSDVESLYLDGGIVGDIADGALVADCSTIDSASAGKVGEAMRNHNLDFVDAPVSGGVTGAKNAALSFIVGGEESAFRRVHSALSAMGKNIFHAGGIGAGQTAKICNNMLLSILMAGTAEAISLGVAHGLNPATLSEIMRKSSGGNWALEVYNPWPGVMKNAPSSNNYAGGFAVNLMAKDSDLAMEFAKRTASPVPLGAMANQIFRLHGKMHGDLDFSSVVKFFNGKIHPKKD